MKIQAINTNTNFRGLFTDKTRENGGNWKMEYQPYSWEKNYSGEIGRMANKTGFDATISKLPDNEEIYSTYTPHRKESSKDILGTESYFVNYDGTMRRTIDEKPAMNREKSLEVLYQKYNELLKMKNEKMQALEKSFLEGKISADNATRFYNSATQEQEGAYRYGQGLFQRGEGLRDMYNAKRKMDDSNAMLKTHFNNLYEGTKKYVDMKNSMLDVNKNKDEIVEEVGKLKDLRASNKLIDISSRTIENPNAPLQEALQNIRTAAEKFICLPHKLVSMSEILQQVNPRFIQGGYNNEIIRYIETLIKRGV